MTRLFTLVVTIIMLAGCISIDVEINDDLDLPESPQFRRLPNTLKILIMLILML